MTNAEREREQNIYHSEKFKENYLEKLNSHGYVVIDNFLPTK